MSASHSRIPLCWWIVRYEYCIIVCQGRLGSKACSIFFYLKALCSTLETCFSSEWGRWGRSGGTILQCGMVTYGGLFIVWHLSCSLKYLVDSGYPIWSVHRIGNCWYILLSFIRILISKVFHGIWLKSSIRLPNAKRWFFPICELNEIIRLKGQCDANVFW